VRQIYFLKLDTARKEGPQKGTLFALSRATGRYLEDEHHARQARTGLNSVVTGVLDRDEVDAATKLRQRHRRSAIAVHFGCRHSGATVIHGYLTGRTAILANLHTGVDRDRAVAPTNQEERLTLTRDEIFSTDCASDSATPSA